MIEVLLSQEHDDVIPVDSPPEALRGRIDVRIDSGHCRRSLGSGSEDKGC